MSNCIFCKIINGEVPNHAVYEDKNVLAFLDIFPHAKGHTVVVPKKHYQDLEQLPEIEWKNLAIGLQKAMDRLRKVLNPEGFNIGINNHEIAGQAVGHVHWHILPRWQKDGGGSMHSIIKNPGEQGVEKIAKLFI
ncbi:MAG: HIT family protein [bacterium]